MLFLLATKRGIPEVFCWTRATTNVSKLRWLSSSSSSSSSSGSSSPSPPSSSSPSDGQIRLSKLISQHATNLTMSRRQAERLVKDGQVTMAGQVIQSPQLLIDQKILQSTENGALIKVKGKPVQFDLYASGEEGGNGKIKQEIPKVWAVHKLKGEVVSENDPQGRPSMMQRLSQGGVGRMAGKKGKNKADGRRFHLKPIGRLDIPTEGLILVTNDGEYSRQMELPSNKIHRVYRARVHGQLSSYKLDRIRQGRVTFDNVRYGPMAVEVEQKRRASRSATNTWVQITSCEGKNRQIRNVFAALGVTVTRLIRIAYGDYQLQSIPPGLAISVPYKPINKQKARGKLRTTNRSDRKPAKNPDRSSVRWVRSVQ